MFACEPVRIDGIPPEGVPVEAEIIEYPQGGRRIQKIGLRSRTGRGDSLASNSDSSAVASATYGTIVHLSLEAVGCSPYRMFMSVGRATL